MNARVLSWLGGIVAVALFPCTALALSEAHFEFRKVIGNVYVGIQDVPLYPVMSEVPETYLSVNLFVIASQDHRELVLIDVPAGAPGLPGLYPEYMAALQENFPDAVIRAIFLTHDHIDHCWTISNFLGRGIPVFASSDDATADPGPFDYPLVNLAIQIDPEFSFPFDGGWIQAVDLKGHTPGQLGYAYHPDGWQPEINWLFVGDALLSPLYYGDRVDPYDITYFFRLEVLAFDTYSIPQWMESLSAVRQQITQHAKLFPSHGAVREGEFWKDPADYIDHTLAVLMSYQ